jgi:hypothetical protein
VADPEGAAGRAGATPQCVTHRSQHAARATQRPTLNTRWCGGHTAGCSHAPLPPSLAWTHAQPTHTLWPTPATEGAVPTTARRDEPQSTSGNRSTCVSPRPPGPAALHSPRRPHAHTATLTQFDCIHTRAQCLERRVRRVYPMLEVRGVDKRHRGRFPTNTDVMDACCTAAHHPTAPNHANRPCHPSPHLARGAEK